MDEIRVQNTITLTGILAGKPIFSHESRMQRFYTFPMEVCRLSGTCDRINVIIREELVPALDDASGDADMISVRGELRSFNNRSGEGSRLIITVFARELILVSNGEWENSVELSGTLCRAPNLRVTPMGREICDIMLAVNRRYSRSDYLPCIAWGLKAREASLWDVGTRIHLVGRFQSRGYIKSTENGPEEKTAYEVSVTDLWQE